MQNIPRIGLYSNQNIRLPNEGIKYNI